MSKVYVFVKNEEVILSQGQSYNPIDCLYDCICGPLTMSMDSLWNYLYSVCEHRLDNTQHQFFLDINDAKRIPIVERPLIHNNGIILEMDVNEETNEITKFCKIHKIEFSFKDIATRNIINDIDTIEHEKISKFEWVGHDIEPSEVSTRALSLINNEFRGSYIQKLAIRQHTSAAATAVSAAAPETAASAAAPETTAATSQPNTQLFFGSQKDNSKDSDSLRQRPSFGRQG